MSTRTSSARPTRRLVAAVILATATSGAPADPPPLPLILYGEARIGPAGARDGTPVAALLAGVVIAQSVTRTEDGVTVYTLDVPGDDPETPDAEGARPGERIDLRLGAFDTGASAIWEAGRIARLDLDAAPGVSAPQALDGAITTLEDTSVPFELLATDLNGDPLTYSVVAAPEHGALSGTASELTYSPAPDFNGEDTLRFQASDGGAQSNLATVAITVRPTPDAPRIEPVGPLGLAEDEHLAVPVRATDPDGDPVLLSASGLPPFASFVQTGDGVGTLTLAPGFDDAGVYTGLLLVASDGLYRDRKFVTLRVSAVTGPPVARDQAVQVAEDDTVAIALEAEDPDGDPVEFRITIAPAHGALSGVPPALIYAPDPDYAGPDAFTFVASDASGDSAPATVSIEVSPRPDAPRLDPIDDVAVAEGSTRVVTVSASDADGDPLTLNASNLPAFAGLTDLGDGEASVTFAPGFDDAGDYPGLTVTASDGTLEDTVTFALTVVDTVPVPIADMLVDRALNVALLEDGATVAAASSVFNSSDNTQPENAIDTNSSSRWIAGNGLTSDEWLKVTLAGTRNHVVEGVTLRGDDHPDSLRDFAVRVSTTGIADTDFVTVLQGRVPQEDTAFAFTFAPRAARHVQLLVHDNWGGGRISVSGFEVWTRAREGGIVSLLEGGATIEATSSGEADRAIDFDTSSRWITAGAADQWLKVRLVDDRVHLVDRIRLLSGGFSDTPQRFEVRVSSSGSDDADFTTVLSATARRDNRAHWYTFAPVPARFVQLFVLDNYGNASQIRVTDFQVYALGRGGAEVPFADASTHPRGEIVEWAWDFGDGSGSSERHPTHRYAAPGVYPVRLTVTDAAGESDTTAIDYRVLHAPQTSFVVTPGHPDEGERTTFADTSSDGDGAVLQRRWQFSHSSGEESGPTTAVTFPDDGTYEATLTVTDDQLLGGTHTESVEVANLAPSVEAGADVSIPWGVDWTLIDTVASDPGTLDRASLVCDVDFGDGTQARVERCINPRDLVHRYANPGVYPMTVTVTDKDGASASDGLSVTATARETLLSIFGALNTGASGNVTARALLVDERTREPLPGVPVTFTLDGVTVTAETGADGVAHAPLVLAEGAAPHVRAALDGDERYLADADRPYAPGEVLAAIGKFGTARGATGRVRRFDPQGNLIKELDTLADTAENDGMCFDRDGSLYITNFILDLNDGGSITKFDNRSGQVIHPWGGFPKFSRFPESCVVDREGNIYTGEVDGDELLRRHDADGNELASFVLETEDRGVDWIDLAADQCTMFYTSEDVSVKRFDVCTNTQLPDFATGLDRPCFALRIRDNGEVLAACRPRVYRLSPTGEVMQTYNVPLVPGQGANDFFAMNLDPDGESFWTGQRNNGRVHRVDIETGDIVQAFFAFTNEPSITELGGLAVVGEPVAALSDDAPRAVAGGPYVVDEGDVLTFDGSGSSDPEGEPLDFAWDFEGQRLTGVRVSVAAPDDLAGSVNLTVTDPGGSTGVDESAVTILNRPPVVLAPATLGAEEGEELTLAAEVSDPGPLDTHAAQVGWGDGSAPDSPEVAAVTRSLSAAHAYADDGAYDVRVTVTDDDGGVGVATVRVTILNTAPTVEAGSDLSGAPGQILTFEGGFTDQGAADTHTVDWRFGDGAVASTLVATHAYGSAGEYTAVLRVTDDDGASGEDGVTVTIVAPDPVPLACDINSDGRVDIVDLRLILAARNAPSEGAGDLRDDDGDGVISVLDARRCVLRCDRPKCAPVGP